VEKIASNKLESHNVIRATWEIILRDSLADILRGRANAHFRGFSFCADLRRQTFAMQVDLKASLSQ
jgi:hypothetical protein